jgi:hypothetical protein
MLLIDDLLHSIIMELGDFVVIFRDLLIQLIQFFQLVVIVFLHVIHHLLVCLLQLAYSLVVVLLELNVKFLYGF